MQEILRVENPFVLREYRANVDNRYSPSNRTGWMVIWGGHWESRPPMPEGLSRRQRLNWEPQWVPTYPRELEFWLSRREDIVPLHRLLGDESHSTPERTPPLPEILQGLEGPWWWYLSPRDYYSKPSTLAVRAQSWSMLDRSKGEVWLRKELAHLFTGKSPVGEVLKNLLREVGGWGDLASKRLVERHLEWGEIPQDPDGAFADKAVSLYGVFEEALTFKG